MGKSGRCMEIVTQTEWDVEEPVKVIEKIDGKEITKVINQIVHHTLTREQIQKVLDRYKSIKQYAYVLHDKDVYTQEEIDADTTGQKRLGDKRPDHWHIVIKSDSSLDIEWVAGLFGVRSNFIQVPRGKNAFLDKVEYLTHERDKEQAKGKHRYDDEEITANFDWRGLLNEREHIKSELGWEPSSVKSLVRALVSQQGWPLSRIEKQYPEEYNNDLQKLKALRLDYIEKRMPMPPLRINFFISGDSNMGKSTLSELLAMSLFPEYEEWEPKEIFYTVGAPGVRFQNYEGQPIVIWEEMRAVDMITEFGRGEIFTMFDARPKSKSQNIKYGSTMLKNSVNIVNGIEDFETFLNGLVGEYVDRDGVYHKAETKQKRQGYRRFPFFINVEEHALALGINEGWLRDDNKLLESFILYKKITGGIMDFMERTGDNKEIQRTASKKWLKGVVEEHQDMRDRHIKKSPDNVDMSGIGEVIEIDAEPVNMDIEKSRKQDSIFDDDTPF